MIENFFAALFNPSIPFIRYAFLAGLFSSIAFGMIGTYVVVKRISYIAGSISHATLAGIGFAVYMKEVYAITWLSPMTGGLISALLTAVILSFVTNSSRERSDTAIGTVWALGMAIGILFIYASPGYGDPMSYLFGNILLIKKADLFMILILDLVIAVIVMLFYNQFLSVSFDEEFARVRGINTFFYDMLLTVLIALTVVLMVSTVGIVMVIAFMTIPPATASLFTNRLWKMMALASILCIFTSFSGLFVSYSLNIPSGATTIITAGVIYFAASLIKKGLTGIRKIKN
jgi:zinc transport system permease protein